MNPKSKVHAMLERAWRWREARGFFAPATDAGTDCALRIFHGPGEGEGGLDQAAIDRFGEHYWLTEWESRSPGARPVPWPEILDFLREKGAKSAVRLSRPERGVPAEPVVCFGQPPAERFTVREDGARYLIQLTGARHPGLFLDHRPLRRWLRESMRGQRVLNTFAYTGSLSVACGLGEAAHVTTLDLSKPTVKWAEENWLHNELPADRARFIAGDVFGWFPRLKREGQRFDCVILDPPSFSRGEKGSFSTAKDLAKLHELAAAVLAPGGFVVTSINSANIAWDKYEHDVRQGFRAAGAGAGAGSGATARAWRILGRIDLPETFPTKLGDPEGRYLKGFIIQSD